MGLDAGLNGGAATKRAASKAADYAQRSRLLAGYRVLAGARWRLFAGARPIGGNRLDLYRLSRNAGDDVVRLHIFGGDAHGTDNPMLTHVHSGQYHRVIRDASFRSDLRFVVADDEPVIQVVRVRINIRVIGNRTAFLDDDFTAIV